MPAYGLTEYGQLWYLTTHEALIKQLGFNGSVLDPSLYFRKPGKESLILVVQVHDYLYAGTPSLSAQFESLLQTKIHIVALEANGFHIKGVHLVQDDTGAITIEAVEKLLNIPLIRLNHSSKGN